MPPEHQEQAGLVTWVGPALLPLATAFIGRRSIFCLRHKGCHALNLLPSQGPCLVIAVLEKDNKTTQAKTESIFTAEGEQSSAQGTFYHRLRANADKLRRQTSRSRV